MDPMRVGRCTNGPEHKYQIIDDFCDKMVYWKRFYPLRNIVTDKRTYTFTRFDLKDTEATETVNRFLRKTKPAYNWNIQQELMRRENNVFNRIDWRGGQTSDQSFEHGYYASREVMESFELAAGMSSNCNWVNCLSFNHLGNLVCVGSDALSIVVWDWAKCKPRHSYLSGHSLKTLQAKFVDSGGVVDIVSSSSDGQVRRAIIPPSGGMNIETKCLFKHSNRVHKIVVVPRSRNEVLSVCVDGKFNHIDLRSDTCTTVTVGGEKAVPLYSIDHHPFAPEFCVSGDKGLLRTYDMRMLNKATNIMEYKDSKDKRNINSIYSVCYNHNGTEILAAHCFGGIYLYNSRNYNDEYKHLYQGHVNDFTIRPVYFFGTQSEYIVSGSDCGRIVIWHKETESVINFMKGDSLYIHCLEPHPSKPILATAGRDYNIKIWMPGGAPTVPGLDVLTHMLHRNII